MPVRKCSNQKYRIGSGKCVYKSKASAERAYTGYRASKHMDEDSPKPETPPDFEVNDEMKKDVHMQMSMREMIDLCKNYS